MAIYQLLNDEVSKRKAISLQKQYQKQLEKIKRKTEYLIDAKSIKLIMGLDISYFGEKQQKGIACGVLWNYLKNKPIDHYLKLREIKFPYIPGLLGFRESPLLAQLIMDSGFEPDLILCDGHGMIHPRKFGEAVQLGFALDIPSIGIAKSPFVGFSKWKSLERKKGNRTEVWENKPNNSNDRDNRTLGYAVCLADKRKPVFVSSGYKTDLGLALKIAVNTTKNHRQPEPLYLADQISRSERRRLTS